jgi:hypothetical protein
MQQNLALDRFLVWRVGYLQSQVEIDALCHALPDLPCNIAENMAQVVNSIREQYQGKGGHGTRGSGSRRCRMLLAAI